MRYDFVADVRMLTRQGLCLLDAEAEAHYRSVADEVEQNRELHDACNAAWNSGADLFAIFDMIEKSQSKDGDNARQKTWQRAGNEVANCRRTKDP